MAGLSMIEGIGEKYAAQLKSAGVRSMGALLKAGSDKKGRKELAKKSGLQEKQILNWVNRADLARIKGIGTQYADLLECTGVDTVPELARRKSVNLHAKMMEINSVKKLVRQIPSLAQVHRWVKQAKELPRVVTH
ncbi:MAG TPA: DUF4332 domain-containing protein [Desulfobulbaceae bacterium]|nr:DUF4332 domain-containing protein [Desulfobulbaceae bacterium]